MISSPRRGTIVVARNPAGASFPTLTRPNSLSPAATERSQGASPLHAEISLSPTGSFVVRDLDSASGTFVNGWHQAFLVVHQYQLGLFGFKQHGNLSEKLCKNGALMAHDRLWDIVA